MSNGLDLAPYYKRLESTDPVTEFGVVDKIVGNSIESHGPNATIGSVCWLTDGERRFPVEVVGFSGGRVITMPLGKIDGIRQGDLLRVSGRAASLGMSEALKGYVLDGFGVPIDGKATPPVTTYQALYSDPSATQTGKHLENRRSYLAHLACSDYPRPTGMPASSRNLGTPFRTKRG